MSKRILLFALTAVLILTNWYYYNAYHNEVDGRLADFYNLQFQIEYMKGDVRSGVDSSGNHWEQEMFSHYGYFLNLEGEDGEKLDVYVNPDGQYNKLFRIIQLHPLTKEFDEYKIMIGFDSADEAKKEYLLHYPDNWQGCGGVKEISLKELTNEW